MKRFFIASTTILTVFVLTVFLVAALSGDVPGAAGTKAAQATEEDGCALSGIVVLEAQSVPTATKVPCVVDELVGWTLRSQEVENGSSTLVYATTSAEGAQWTIRLQPSCSPPPTATSGPSTDPAVRRHSSDRREDTSVVNEEWFQFDGGCASYVVSIADRYEEQRVFDELEAAFGLVDRSDIDDSVRRRSDGAYGLDPG